MSGVDDSWCRKCRETVGSLLSGLSGPADSNIAGDAFHICPRCGSRLTTEEQDDLLSRMLKKFGLLDEAGTVLERRERGA